MLLVIFAGFANACTRECEDTRSCMLIAPFQPGDASVPPRDASLDAEVGPEGDATVPVQRPVAIIRFSRIAEVGDRSVFDGTESFDPRGFPLTFRWRLISSPPESRAMLENFENQITSLVSDREGLFEVELIVNNGADDSAPARVTVTVSAERRLSEVIDMGPWNIVQSANGIAVDHEDRVFITDFDRVYVVDGSNVETYLEAEMTHGGFYDLDIGEDDALYLLTGDAILASTEPNTTRVHRSLDRIGMARDIGVVEGDRIGVVADGLYTVNSTNAVRVYADHMFEGNSGCATADFAMQRSGVFLYEPGCNGSPLIKGNLDGSGEAVLFQSTLGDPEPPFEAENFICTARDPTGGFKVMIRDFNFAPHLLHIDEDGSWRSISTTPSLAEAQRDHSTAFEFGFCSMAVGPSGVIFVQTIAQLWRID